MPFIRTSSSNKSAIIKDLAFCSLLDGKLPDPEVNIRSLFDNMGDSVRERDSRITREALSNTRGDWYEWLLAIQALNCFINNRNLNCAILLPNVSQFDVSKLYTVDLSELIDDLRLKVKETSEVQLITSNPDFVIIDSELANGIIQNVAPIEEFTPQTLYDIEHLYTQFINRCNFEEIVGYVSVKTSFRPDRRLQISHEGSLAKAIYTHLQTRKWVINPRGLKYYAIATEVGDSDRAALKTVATHSITTVSSLPQAAVDDVFEVNSLNQAQEVFEKILSV